MRSLLLIFLLATPAMGAQLTLEDYLSSVRQKHLGLKGAQTRASGATDRAGETVMLTQPSFFINAQWADDSSQKQNPSFQGTRAIANSYSIGLTEMTSFGTQARLSYDFGYLGISGVTPGIIPINPSYTGKPSIEVSQSLWRNAFGRETRAIVEAGEAQNLATKYAESFTVKAILAESESLFWRMAAARQMKQVQSVSLERSQKMRDWASRRAANALGDKSDLYQAESAYKMRQMELAAADEEERAASIAFNAQRGVASDKVEEELPPLPVKATDKFEVPARGGLREDTKAAEAASQASAAAAQIGYEKNQPTLEVYGAYAYSNMNAESQKAFDRSFSSEFPTSALGVRLNMPLEFGQMADDRDGYRKEAAASEMKFQRKRVEEERDWQTLTQKLRDARKRLELAEAFEKTQKEKYTYERERQTRGRSTTYFVLLFEQDYATAQANTLRVQAEILNIMAQLKTFGGAI